MMDGYSVQDAASVLGVPEGRVWELLARGVLAGSPDGDSMRVFLKGDAAPVPHPSPPEALPRSNGNGGPHGAEASAFRELLTEFRNLTERYGQALLALGEARGEVAGLRSRVELLEARLDLRLPTALDASPISWEAPAPSAPAPESPAPVHVEAEMPAPAPVRRTPRQRKARTTRAAVAGFAEALARAQDPNPAEVGEASISPEVTAEAVTADAPAVEIPPAEAPAVEASEEPGQETVADVAVAAEAEEIVVAEEVVGEEVVGEEVVAADAEGAKPPETTYTAAVVEPDWFADGDFSWLDAADLEARSQSEAIALAAAPSDLAAEQQMPAALESESEPEPEPVAAAMPEPESEPVVAAMSEPESEPVVAAMSEPKPEPVLAAMPEPEPVTAVLPEAEPVAALAPEPEPMVAATPEVVVAEVPGPEPEPEVAVAPEPAMAGEPEPEPVMGVMPQAEAEPQPEPVLAAEPEREPAPVGQMEAVEVGGAGEEPVMWLGGPREAADEIEVGGAASRGEPIPPPDTSDRRRSVAWPDTDRGGAVAQAVAPPLAMTEDELAQLARDEGWDETEVALIRAMISRPAPPAVELPGGAELDEAMSALQAVPIEAPGGAASGRQWAKPATPVEDRSGYDDWAFEVEPGPAQARASSPPVAPNRAGSDPDWLRRRRGPAATAYRRIRRIFTG